jgi:hypothetical protein
MIQRDSSSTELEGPHKISEESVDVDKIEGALLLKVAGVQLKAVTPAS